MHHTHRRLALALVASLPLFALAVQQAPPRSDRGGGKRKPPQDGVVKPEMRDTIRGAMYADNWFAMYVNGKLVTVDSIDFLPHNVVAIDLLPEYPMTVAVIAKDNADPHVKSGPAASTAARSATGGSSSSSPTAP